MVDLLEIIEKNPYFLASGPAKYGQGYAVYENPVNFLMLKASLLNPGLFGGVITKTLTLEPRKGNYTWHKPWQVLRPISGGWVNRFGWNNCGIKEFRYKIYPKIRFSNLIPSIGAMESTREFLDMIDILNKIDIMAIELNISCPHVDIVFRNDVGKLEKFFIKAVKESRHPLIVKLGAVNNHGLREQIARDCGVELGSADESVVIKAWIAKQCGIQAVSLINTVAAYIPGFGHCGLSGPVIKPIALETIRSVARATTIPIIGCGGINSIDDCRDFFDAGASAAAFSSIYLPRLNMLRHIKQIRQISKMLAKQPKNSGE